MGPLLHVVLALSFPSPPSSSSSSSSFSSFNKNNNGDNYYDSFSLSKYQKARAIETVQALDASRQHFQIMFVDDDNVLGRTAEGLLARVAEHNDAMFILFPASSTMEESRNAPRDAAAPLRAVTVCQSLGLCETRSTMMGTAFDVSYLDEYDLVIAMNDDIRLSMLRSLTVTDQEYYSPKVRLLSEFLSPEFCSVSDQQQQQQQQQQLVPNEANSATNMFLEMLDQDLRDRVSPCADLVIDSSSNILMSHRLEHQIAALILASSGITKFCLDTMQTQFDLALDSLMEMNFYLPEHLELTNDEADDQLRKCSHSVTGFFSREQRKSRFERHICNLSKKLDRDDQSS